MGVTVGQEDFVTWKTGALFLEVIHFGLCISIFCFRMASSAFFYNRGKREIERDGKQWRDRKTSQEEMQEQPF